MATPETTPPEAGTIPSPEIDGWKLVAAMLTFGFLASGTLWGYWYYHTAPFIPLQVAIADEFPGSAPRVDGGQRRIHKDTAGLLWIIMRVDFNPKDDSEKSQRVVDRVVELAYKHVEIEEFEKLNVRLFFGEMEKEIHKVDFEVPVEKESPAE
jgi:hypothetical protein